MAQRAATNASTGFCKADIPGIVQAMMAIVFLIGSLWSIGLLF